MTRGRGALAALGLAATFAGALAAGAALHADTASSRRLAARLLSQLLSQALQGKITIERIEHADLGGFEGAYATVDDPRGVRVLTVEGMRARANWVPLVWSVLRKSSEIELTVTHTRVEQATAIIEPDADGIPTLADAFTPRPSAPGAGTGGRAPEIKIWLPDVQLRAGCVRGRLAPLPVLDVDIANVTGSVFAGSARAEVRVKRYSITARGITAAPLRGTAQTLVLVPPGDQDISLWGTFDGYLGEVQVAARAGLIGKHLDLVGDMPKATSEAMRALVPGWPVFETVSAHVVASGTLPDLTTTGTARVGDGTVDWSGTAWLGKNAGVDLDVGARGVDLRTFAPGLPRSRVFAAGKVKLSATPDDIAGEYWVATEPFRFDALDVPKGSITGGFTSNTASGKALFEGAALRSRAEFKVHPEAGPDSPAVVELDGTATMPDIGGIPWLAPIGKGAAQVRARGRIAGGQLDLHVDADVASYKRGILSIDHANVSGVVRGAPLDPRIEATLRGRDLRVGPLAFTDALFRATGPVRDLHLSTTVGGEGLPTVTGRGRVVVSDARASLRDIELYASRGQSSLVAKVASIEAADDRLDIEGVLVEGAGAPITGSMHLGSESAKLSVLANEVDLAKVSDLLLPNVPLGGKLSLEADIEVTPHRESGHLRARLDEGRLPGVSGVTAEVEAATSGRQFSGGANLTWGTLGSITVTAVDAHLDGPIRKPASWRRASGSLQYNASIDLAEVEKVAPWLSALADVRGKLYTRGGISREGTEGKPARGDEPPTLDVLVWTDGLDLRAGAKEGSSDKRARAWQTTDLDLQLGVHLDGPLRRAEVTGRLVDKEGIFAALSAAADVSTPELLTHPARALAELRDLPLSAHLALPRRALARYPELVRPSLLGEVEGSLVMSGTLNAPRVTAALRGYGMQSASSDLAIAIDAEAAASYDGTEAVMRCRARRPEGIVLDATAAIRAPLADVLGSDPGSSWEASGSAELAGLPLASLPILSDRQIAGTASGRLTFRGLNRNASAEAELNLSDVKIDKAEFPRGVAILRIAQGGAVLSTKLDQVDGGVSATASGRVEWRSGLIPTLNPKAPVDLFFAAKNLRAAALYPVLFEGIFTYFDGRLDGTLHLRSEPGADKTAEIVDGAFELRNGVFQIPEVGQEFRDATANIFISPDGTVYVTDLAANGITGGMTGSAMLKLRGFAFDSGEGTVYVSKKRPIPLTIEGVALGDAWGTLTLRAKMGAAHTVLVDVDVPTLHLELPESSTRDVQGLSDNAKVEVGMGTPSGELVPLLIAPPRENRSAEALKWHIQFNLGQDVLLKRGSMMAVALRGRPIVDLTDTVHVSGEVTFVSGEVEVMGKRFEIEQGSAKFVGDDPGNPNISVTARWDAPDGTRIYATYDGPLRTGTLSFRAEPARSQSEILAILLFGTTESGGPVAGAREGDTGYAAAAIAGSQATQDLNRVLSNVSSVDITTRVDTSKGTQNPTPEVGVQISRKVSAEVSYRTRLPLPGEKPDRVLLTLDWRFLRNWSIATTVGDAGSSVLDLIWQYRY